MKYRKLGKTGFIISDISLGTWQLGGKWGNEFDDNLARKTLEKAVENGVNFFDTADVYSGGKSEQAIGEFLKSYKEEKIYVATKCGRGIIPHTNEGYRPDVLRSFVENSLKRLKTDCLDLIQLHCPPTDVYYRPEIFKLFERLKEEGKIKNMGVSIEKAEEGIKAMEYENVTSVQVIYNMFRQRPQENLFNIAKEKNVGLIIRVPLASGLLTGKFTLATTFTTDDHRNFNKDGKFFDKGETFGGIPYDIGVNAVDLLKKELNRDDLVNVALQWILRREEVSCIIPGASGPEQAFDNAKKSDQQPLKEDEVIKINTIYQEQIKPHVHQRW